MNTVTCRARISGGCENGDSVSIVYGADGSMEDDGTFLNDLLGGTVICTPCYIWLMPLTPSGRGLDHELDPALAEFRANRGAIPPL